MTSCTRPLAETRLKAAGLPIPPRLLTSNDVKFGKPNPEPYLKGAAILGFPAMDCVVFEDAPAGIRAGKAAGATVISFTTTAPDSELDQAGADVGILVGEDGGGEEGGVDGAGPSDGEGRDGDAGWHLQIAVPKLPLFL